MICDDDYIGDSIAYAYAYLKCDHGQNAACGLGKVVTHVVVCWVVKNKATKASYEISCLNGQDVIGCWLMVGWFALTPTSILIFPCHHHIFHLLPHGGIGW
jgi:hypothetical protein